MGFKSAFKDLKMKSDVYTRANGAGSSTGAMKLTERKAPQLLYSFYTVTINSRREGQKFVACRNYKVYIKFWSGNVDVNDNLRDMRSIYLRN